MNNFGSIQKMLQQADKTGKLVEFASSEDAKQLEKFVDKDALEKAMAQGDYKQMENILRKVLSTGEGKALAEKITGIMK